MQIGDRDDILQKQQQLAEIKNAMQPGQIIDTGAAVGDGKGVSADFSQLYKELASRKAQQKQQKQKEESEARRNASFVDRAIKGQFDIADAIFGFGQKEFQDSLDSGGMEKKPIETLTSFAATLPGGIIGSPIRGAAQMYEVATGRDVQQLEDGTIPKKELTASQRGWELADAITNLGGGFVGGTGRVLGAAMKGAAKAGTGVGKAAGKLMPNEGKGLVSRAIDEFGGNKAVQIGGQLAFDTAEEGAEEFLQTFAEHGRAGDEFDDSTLSEAIESAKWGAVGGAMMSAGGQAANYAMGAMNRDEGDKAAAEATSPDASGFHKMGEVTNPISRRMPTQTAKLAYDSSVTQKQLKKEGSFGLRIASNPKDIGLDDGWLGIEGLRAAWKASKQEGREQLAEMLGFKGELDVVEEAIAKNDLNTLNSRIGGHYDYNLRSIKREPGLSNTTIHNIYVTRIVDGDRMQLHPLTSQLGNGDIDGDMKTLLYMPDHGFMLPSQLFLNNDGISTDFNLEFMPDLDTDVAREKLRINLIRDFKPIAEKMRWNGYEKFMEDLVDSASRTKRDAGGEYGPEHKHMNKFMEKMNSLANTAMKFTGDREIQSDAVSTVVASMYDTLMSDGIMRSIFARDLKMAEDLTEQTVKTEMGSREGRRTTSGSVGNAKSMAAVARTLDMITSLCIGLRKGASFRNGCVIKYNVANKREKFAEIADVLLDQGTDSIERTVANYMKLVNVGEHINENIGNLFENFVLIRFMSEMNVYEERRMGQRGALDPEDVINKYVEVRNEIAEAFNESVKKEFHTGLKDIVGAVEKIQLDPVEDREVAIGYMMQTIGNFDFEDFFDIPESSRYYGMRIIDGIRIMANDPNPPAIIGHVGEKTGNLINSMVRYERQSYDRAFEKIMEDNRNLPKFTVDDIQTDSGYVRGTTRLEIVMHVLDPVVSLDQNLGEVYDAAKTDLGWYVLSGNEWDIANAQTVAAMRTAYRDVFRYYEQYENASNDKERKAALERATNAALQLRNDSALSRSIYAELADKGTIKFLRFITDISKTYKQKQEYMNVATKTVGVRNQPLLISALMITQPNFDMITSRIRENRKTISQVSIDAINAARNEGIKTVEFVRGLNKADQSIAMLALAEMANKHKYKLNDDLFVAVIADSTNIHLADNEKGTTIDSAVMFYQQMEMILKGGPISVSAEMQERTIGMMSEKDFLANKAAWIDILFNRGEIYLESGTGADVRPINLERIFEELGIGPLEGKDGTMSINDFEKLIEVCPQVIRLIEPHIITPSLSRNEEGGTNQTGSEKTMGHLANRLENYMRKRSRESQNLIREQEKAELEEKLLMDRRFPVAFVAWLKFNNDGTVSRSEILQKKEWVVNGLYEIIGSYADGDDIDVMDSLIEGGASFLGSAVAGDRSNPFIDIADDIVNGNTSILFSPKYIISRIHSKAMEWMIPNLSQNMQDWITGNNKEYTPELSELKDMIELLQTGYIEILTEARSKNELVDDINGAAFAMIGATRMRRLMTQTLRSTVDYNLFPEDTRAEVEGIIQGTIDFMLDELVDDKFMFEDELNLEPTEAEWIDPDGTVLEQFEILNFEKSRLERSLRSIIEDPENGASDETIANVWKSFEKAWSLDGQERLDALEQIRISANNIILADRINKVASFTGSEVNQFFLEDTFTVSNLVMGMIDDIRNDPDVKVTQHRLNKRDNKKVLPKLRTHDPKNAFTALMAGRHVSEGQVGINVGTNGWLLTNLHGLAFVPHDRSCNVGPTEPVPIEKLVSDDEKYSELIGMIARITLANGKTFTLRLPRYMNIADPKYKGATIEVWDSRQCSNPMCHNHYGSTPNRFSKGYLKTTSAFFELLSWAQEQKNLKLKKTLELSGHIVSSVKHDKFVRESIDIDSSNQEEIVAAVKAICDRMQIELSNRYKDVLDQYDALDDIDKSIPDTIAAMNSTVVVLTGANGEISYASMYEIRDKNIFNEIVEKLGGKIMSAQAQPISFEQINSKIEAEILAGLNGKSDYSETEVSDIAWKAVTEWRNYGTSSASVQYLMEAMPLYQMSGPTSVIPAGHYTAEQLFRDAINPDGTIKNKFQRRPTSVDASKAEDLIRQNMKFQGKKNPDELEFLISQVDVADDYNIEFMTNENRDLYDLAVNKIGRARDKFYTSHDAAVIIADNNMTSDRVEKMIRNGYKGFDVVIVPATADVMNMDIMYKREASVWGESFVVINLKREHEDDLAASDKVTFGEGHFFRNKVVLTYWDMYGQYYQGDAPYVVSENFAKKIKDTNTTDIRIKTDPLKNVIRNVVSYGIVERDDLASVCRAILENKANIVYPTDNKRIGDIEAETKKWLELIANGTLDESVFHEDGYMKGNVSINTPFVIISAKDAAGNEFFMPGYATGSIPKTVDMISGYRINRSTGEFEFHQSTELPFDEAVDLKGTDTNGPNKGETRVHVEADLEMPEFSRALDDDLNVIIGNGNTRAGRLAGSSEKQLKESLFLAAKMTPTNFALTLTNDGVDINPYLNYSLVGEPVDALSMEEVEKLMDHRHNDFALLRAIANGQKKVFVKEKSHANMVVKRLAAEILNGNGLTLANLICPYESNIKFSKIVEMKYRNPERLKDLTLECNSIVPRQIEGTFRNFSFVDMKTLYSTMNKNIVPDPFSNEEWEPGSTIMDSAGNVWLDIRGEKIYAPARFSFFTFMDQDSRVGEDQVNSSFSMQQRIGYALRNGVSPSDVDILVDAIRVKNADMSGYTEIKNEFIGNYANYVVDDYDPRQNLAGINPLRGLGVDRYYEQVEAQAKTFENGNVKIRDGKDVLDNPMKSERFEQAYESFLNATGGDRRYVSVDLFFNAVVKPSYGWSWSDGEGDLTIPVDHIYAATQDWVSLLNSPEMYLIEGKTNGTTDSRRISFGLLPKHIALQLWEASPKIRQKFGDIDTMFEGMLKQQENTEAKIAELVTTGKGGAADRIAKKRSAYWLLNAFVKKTWSIDVPNNDLYSNVVSQDYRDSLILIESGIFGEEVTETFMKINEQSVKAREAAIRTHERLASKGYVEYESPGDSSTMKIVAKKGRRKDWWNKALDGCVDIQRVMAILDPAVPLGNLLEGHLRGAVQDIATSMPGTFMPWGSDKRTFNGEKDNVLRAISQREDVQKFVSMFTMATLLGDDEVFIVGLQEDGATIESVADKLYGDQRWWPKTRDRIFSAASLDKRFMGRRTYRMLKFLDTYITQGDYPSMMMTDSDGITQFERSLTADPVNAFVNMLAIDSPVKIELLRAINTSDTFSMAQRNAVSIMAENVMKKSSVANFITSVTMTPFVRYNTNIAGRVLNWFMPVSTMNYVMIETMAKYDTFKDMNIEQAQVYDSMRSALLVDAARMGFTAVAMILLALGCIDYPDDENKKGNYGEYMFMGRRINEDFVLDDLTGPIFPYACFMKTVMDGKPRIDLLFNGIAEISSKNPLMKVGEIFDVILSPDKIVEDMQDVSENYKDTLAGSPDVYNVAVGTIGATTLALLGKMFTPSLIKNLSKSYDYERSYKRIWDPNAGNVDVSTGTVDETVLTDPTDAMIRKVTRDNMVLGVILNIALQADTSYTGFTSFGAKREMTPVMYSDPYQRFIMEKYSIFEKDESGEYIEKSENEKQAIALNIIATMQSYDNMEDLYDEGFILDSRTRRYVGDVIWQTVAQIQTTYYNWANSAEADYYVLGNGDFNAGQEVKQQAYNAMQQSVNTWKDFYYKKLNSEPMKRGIQKYMRENVQYWQDDNGEWYASGFRRGMNGFNYLTGLKAAPGTIESAWGTTNDNAGTMGYSGDWATPSKVTGLTTGERSLVALPQDIEETVPFDELADNHPELAAAIEAAKTGTYSKYGSRSGGSGGSGGTSIYSKPSSVNVPSARTMSSNRPYDSKFDYLRPGFETKGSREASRRSDF